MAAGLGQGGMSSCWAAWDVQTCSRDVQPAAEGPLCPPAVPLGTVVVPGDSDLELCRAHIERLQQVNAGSRRRWGTGVSSLAVNHPDLCFCLNRSLMGLEPSPRCATNYPPSGVSWTVSLP